MNKVTEILSNVKILKATPPRTQDAENTERGSASEYFKRCLTQSRILIENFNSDITVIIYEDVYYWVFILALLLAEDKLLSMLKNICEILCFNSS